MATVKTKKKPSSWIPKGKTPQEVGIQNPGKKWRIQICPECKEDFWAQEKQNRTYCSGSCRSKSTTKRFGPPNRGIRGFVPSTAFDGSLRGEKHWNWKGGSTPDRKLEMGRNEYKEWRFSVYKRDNFTCQICGDKKYPGHNVKLNADHIKPWSLFPELRYETENGRTLCEPCHRKTPTWGSGSWTRNKVSV